MKHKIPCVKLGFALPATLISKYRILIDEKIIKEEYTESGELYNLVNGIWWTTGSIATHVDSNFPKIITTGLILINDCGANLVIGNATPRTYKIPSGSMFRINSSFSHSTQAKDNKLFCFMAWDSKPSELKSLDETAIEMHEALTSMRFE
jgi:hypothetical protein